MRADDPRINAGAAIWRTQEMVIAVAAGGEHNLLLTKNGTVLASGSNERGQSSVPLGLSDVIAIAAGLVHSVALRRDGTVVAWGNNTRQAVNVPDGLTDVVGITAGAGHTAALRRDGTVVTWGQVQKENESLNEDLGSISSISSGWESIYAVHKEGTISAWGRTEFGLPVVPDGLRVRRLVAVDGSRPRWVAIKIDGTVVTSGIGAEPKVPERLAGVVQISAEESHYMALLEDGSVIGWGSSPVRHTIPHGLHSVKAVSAGSNHSLALLADGRVVAWGKNGYRQLQGPPGSTIDAVGWDTDGYYLPKLQREPWSSSVRKIDPYMDEYGSFASPVSALPTVDSQEFNNAPRNMPERRQAASVDYPMKPQSGGCFVATAIYGNYDCPEVWVLRRWRDSRLETSPMGRGFIRLYYAVSPRLVKLFGSKPWFASSMRSPLDLVVRLLKNSGYSDRPYQDRLG